MQRQIEAHQFEIPNGTRRRLLYMLKHAGAQFLTALCLFAFNVYTWIVVSNLWGNVAFSGVTSIALVLSVYWMVRKYKNAKVSYTLYADQFDEGSGIHFEFDHRYYVPKESMRDIVDGVVDNFSNVVIEDKNLTETYVEAEISLNGSRFSVIANKPYARGQNVLGKTYPDEQRSVIYGPRALDPAVMGYEMKLHVMHDYFPFQSEEKDIEFMKEKNIL